MNGYMKYNQQLLINLIGIHLENHDGFTGEPHENHTTSPPGLDLWLGGGLFIALTHATHMR
jgi:hypothetical protein